MSPTETSSPGWTLDKGELREPAAAAVDRPPPGPRGRVETVIRPAGRWPRIDFGELLGYRGLFLFLVWRDIKVRYAQSILGAGWAILQPVLTMVVFTVIFGNFAKIPSDDLPYPIFSLTALVPWTYFSTALNQSSQSLVANPALITKVYFPRLVIPLTPVLAGLVDFAIASVILALMMVAYGVVPDPMALILIPLLVLIMMATATGVGCWLSALNVQYRDVKHVTPFLIQVWMYLSPIVYPMSLIPEQYRPLYALNPMAGVIEGFRSVLLQSDAVGWGTIAISFAVSGVLLVSGSLFFRHTEKVFADVA